MYRRRAFTMIELLVVVAILALLIAIMLPSIAKAREAARLTTCGTNLSSVGKAMQVYAASETVFPTQPPPKSTRFGMWSNPPVPQGVDDILDPIAQLYINIGISSANYYQMGQPMSNLWLLVLQGTSTPKQFICPSDPTMPTPADKRYETPVFSSNGVWVSFGMVGELPGNTFSYAFAYPWIAGQSMPAAWWRANAQNIAVLGADIGPSMSAPLNNPTAAPGTTASNSKNHEGKGQNVLYSDAHVSFVKRNDVGEANDNIYTADSGNIYVKAGGAAVNAPAQLNVNPLDIILVPARP